MASKEEVRKERLRIIKASIEKSTNPDYDRLVNSICMDWGISKRTALEYVKIVCAVLSLSLIHI